MASISEALMPILAAYNGQSCTNCCVMELKNNNYVDEATTTTTNSSNDKKKCKLLRCTGCKLAHYCCKDCQREDWVKRHKVECKILILFKHFYDMLPPESWDRHNKALTFLKMVPKMLKEKHMLPIDNTPSLKQFNEKFRQDRFLKFAMYGRACPICLLNDFSAAVSDNEEEWKGKNLNIVDWTSCPECGFGACCTKEHWEEYQPQHTPEICQAYRRCTEIEYFHYQHVKKHNERFLYLPSKIITGPSALTAFPKTWDEYFTLRYGTGNDDYQEIKPFLPSAFIPASTHLLSQPVTCVSAMYQYGISNFNNVSSFHLHVVGANWGYELSPTAVWEEILHLFPTFDSITVHFVGPDACSGMASSDKELPTYEAESCPDCQLKGRKRQFGMYAYTYHEYATKYLKTKKHAEPHMIVAFNTGMHEVDKDSWKTSLNTILDLDVPSYFTSYAEVEAVQDFDVLSSPGVEANILQKAPQRNPFGDQHLVVEATTKDRVDKFFACNTYGMLVKGRKRRYNQGKKKK